MPLLITVFDHAQVDSNPYCVSVYIFTGCNVLLSEKTPGQVKLTNFSASVLIDTKKVYHQIDEEYLPLVLPTHLSPPEVWLSGCVNVNNCHRR